MHELALMMDLVETVCDRVGQSRVAEVHLVVGRESGVLVDSLRFCFDVCTQGTRLEGARLVVLETLDQELRLESVEVYQDVQDLRL